MPASLDETIAVTRSPEPGSMDEETASATRAPTHAGWVEPKRGALVGRYVVLARLGAGAMGVVLAAYDRRPCGHLSRGCASSSRARGI